MGLPRWPEVRLNTDVHLVNPAAKPATSSQPELFRFFNFIESESPPIKLASNILTACGRGYLNVIYREMKRLHDIEITNQSVIHAIALPTRE
jgi:hypothetical protein